MNEVKVSFMDGETEREFSIRKMNAFQAEAWLHRAGLLLGKEAIDVKDFQNIPEVIKALCRVNYREARPLLDELLECCSIVVGKMKKQISSSEPDMISSPMTLTRLRVEALKANFGFLAHDGNFTSLIGQVSESTAKK